MSDDAKPFEKWAPLLALCRDALRVMPPGWRERSVHIEIDDGERFAWSMTNGPSGYNFSWGEKDLKYLDLKHDVASKFVKASRESAGDDGRPGR
jgi:hypothetical protein